MQSPDVDAPRPPVIGRHAPSADFTDFVTARSSALRRIAWVLTGDDSRAEDLVQESLAKAWRHWPAISRMGQPEAYVRRVMINTSISAFRRRWRAEVPVERLPESAAPDAVDAVHRAELRMALRDALAALTPRQRAVVALRYLDDLTEAQAADLLGCSRGTVKSLASRALARLRDSPHLQGLLQDVSITDLASAGTTASVPIAQITEAASRRRRTAVLTGGALAGSLVVAGLALQRGAARAWDAFQGASGRASGSAGGPGALRTSVLADPWTTTGAVALSALFVAALVGLFAPPGGRAHPAAGAAARVCGVAALAMLAQLVQWLPIAADALDVSWDHVVGPALGSASIAVIVATTSWAVRRRSRRDSGAAADRGPRRTALARTAGDLAATCVGVLAAEVTVDRLDALLWARHAQLAVHRHLALEAMAALLVAVVAVLAGGVPVRRAALRAAARRFVGVAAVGSTFWAVVEVDVAARSVDRMLVVALAVTALVAAASAVTALALPWDRDADRRSGGPAARAAFLSSYLLGSFAVAFFALLSWGATPPVDLTVWIVLLAPIAVLTARRADRDSFPPDEPIPPHPPIPEMTPRA